MDARFPWLMVVYCLLLATSGQPSGDHKCPDECRCTLDDHGRSVTACSGEGGGLSDLIPVVEMATETEILIISGSENLPNNLSLGPIFKGLNKLQEIHLIWSGIPSLGEHSFWGLNNLRVLNVTHNSLNSLVDTNFRGATTLKHLDLSGNKIESVPSAVFRHVKYLQSLSLANNIIPKLVPRIFFGLTRLKSLDLSYNPLGDLQPELFSDVPVLQEFKCAGCGLKSISGSLLKMLPHLKILNLNNNRLTQIPHRLQLLKNLQVLQLNGNHISFVEREVISGSPLTHLQLGHNHIIRIEKNAFINSSITHLDLSYNRLSNIDLHGFGSSTIKQLYNFKLSGNSLRIEDLFKILPETHNLRKLSIGDTGLTLVPAGLMHHIYSLKYLNISGNYISTMPLGFFNSAPNLEELDISLNTFRGFPVEFLNTVEAARNLRILSMHGNPFYCDRCHVEPLIKWLQASPDQESSCKDPRLWTCITCIGPKSFSGISLALLPNADLPQCILDPGARNLSREQRLPGRSIVPASFSDDSSFPISHMTRVGGGSHQNSITDLLSKELPLIVICVCAFVFVILCIIISIVIVHSRQSAYYYTNEKDLENSNYFVCDKINSPTTPGIKNGKRGFYKKGQCQQEIYGNGGTDGGSGNGISNKSNGLRNNFNKNNNRKIPMRPSHTDSTTMADAAVTIATIDELADIAGSTELVDGPASSTSFVDGPSSSSSAIPEDLQVTEITILECEPKPGSG